MRRAGVEEGGRGGAEAAAFVEIVEAMAQPSRSAFPGTAPWPRASRKLGRFEAVGLPRLVDDQIAVVEGLNAEIVEVEVGAGIQASASRSEVVLQQLGAEPLDLHAALEVALEGAAVRVFEISDAVADDIPIEHLLVDVGQEDAPGEPGEVRVALDQGSWR